MKRRRYLLAVSTFALVLCTGCAKINLGKSGSGTGSGSTSRPTGSSASGQAPPPIENDWTVSFMYNDQPFESTVTFTQKGKALAGQGRDAATSKEFFIQNGTVDGTKVHFSKKYADVDPSRSPVDYTGDLEYENDADYHGWKMGGHYKTAVGGKQIDDKWVAIPAVDQQPQQAQQPEQQSDPGQAEQQPEQAAQPEPSGPPPKQGPNISGQWNATYQYNFKKVTSKLWLEQDGGNVTGHGTDVNTNERFTIERGWYHYPKVTLVCKYNKGKSAKETRQLTVKGTVSNKLVMKGETQFGGGWDAKIVR